jgi:hypothetical protein
VAKNYVRRGIEVVGCRVNRDSAHDEYSGNDAGPEDVYRLCKTHRPKSLKM